MADSLQKIESTLLMDYEKKFGLFIYPKQFASLYPNLGNYKSCFYRYQLIKDALGKKNHQRLTVIEVANYEGIAPEKVYQMVYLYHNIPKYPKISH